MDEIEFSGKLSKQTLEEYKCPVHYISHHAVSDRKRKAPQNALSSTHQIYLSDIG